MINNFERKNEKRMNEHYFQADVTEFMLFAVLQSYDHFS